MLATPRWAHLAPAWGAEKRRELVMAWHKAVGASIRAIVMFMG